MGRVSVLVEVPDVLRYIPTHTRKSQSLRSSCMASETLKLCIVAIRATASAAPTAAALSSQCCD